MSQPSQAIPRLQNLLLYGLKETFWVVFGADISVVWWHVMGDITLHGGYFGPGILLSGISLREYYGRGYYSGDILEGILCMDTVTTLIIVIVMSVLGSRQHCYRDKLQIGHDLRFGGILVTRVGQVSQCLAVSHTATNKLYVGTTCSSLGRRAQ